ncbi:MAG: hypothetical protein ACTSRI_12175 [Promethearchaeota archaeon]
MGKEKEKDKDKKDKDKKDKDKKDKDKKDKDKKDKDKKDKDKKDKDKKKKDMGDEAWKLNISSIIDNYIDAYEKITKVFQDIDSYILKGATSKEEFIIKVKESINKLPETNQELFNSFLKAIE